MPTFCYVSEWCKTMHNDVPVISVKTAEEIIETMDDLIEHTGKIKVVGDAGHEYVNKVHNAKTTIKKWESLIKYVNKEYRR